jgi:ketol-acid reductoisomerase
VRDGSFAQRWMDEYAGGQKELDAMRRAEREHPIEVVGREVRALFAQGKQQT